MLKRRHLGWLQIGFLLWVGSSAEAKALSQDRRIKHAAEVATLMRGKNCKNQMAAVEDIALLASHMPTDHFMKLSLLGRKATLKCLKSPDAEIRKSAVLALEYFADAVQEGSGVTHDQVKRMKIKIAIKDKSLVVREAALGSGGHQWVQAPDLQTLNLMEKTLLKDKNEKIRELSVRVLASSGRNNEKMLQQQIKMLQPLLKDTSSKVVVGTITALASLGAMKDQKIKDEVKKLSASKHKDVVLAVKSILKDAAPERMPAQTVSEKTE